MKMEGAVGGSKGVPTPSLKVVILGDLGVGKTCLRSQFIYHMFTNAYKATIGGDYLTATVYIPTKEDNDEQIRTDKGVDNDEEHDSTEETLMGCNKMPLKVNLQIWDTAGQERFNSISQAFYRGTDVVILVYDITSYESVLSLREWFERFIQHCHVEQPGVMVVGNKVDRANERSVERDEIREILNKNTDVSIDSYVRDWDTDLFEVSCKKLELVDKLFHRAGQLGVELLSNSQDKTKQNMLGFDTIDLQHGMNHTASSRCMC